MASVTFPPAVGGDGSTVSDDANPSTGLANGGHRTRFVPALAQIVAVGTNTVNNATAAAASAVLAQDWASKTAGPVSGVEYSAKFWAQSALSSAGTNATSTSSIAIGTGSKSLTLAQTGKAFVPGQYVQIVSSATGDNWMVGYITAFTPGTGAMTVFVTQTGGTGTIASWVITPATASYLPTQTGNSGAYLTTNGSVTSWVQPPAAASQAEMETGTEANLRQVSPLRVRQSVTAWWNGTFPNLGVDGIAIATTTGQTLTSFAGIPAGRRAAILAPTNNTASVTTLNFADGWSMVNFNGLAAGASFGGLATGTAHGAFYSTSNNFRMDPPVVGSQTFGNSPAVTSTAVLSATLGVAAYQPGGTASYSVLACDLSASSNALGAGVSLNTNTGNEAVRLVALTSTTFAAIYRTAAGASTSIVIGSVSGTTITLGTPVALSATANLTQVIRLTNSLLVVYMADGSMVAVSVSGTTATAGTAVTGLSTTAAMALISTSSFLFVDSSDARVYSVSGTTITAGSSASTSAAGQPLVLQDTTGAGTTFLLVTSTNCRFVTVAASVPSVGASQFTPNGAPVSYFNFLFEYLGGTAKAGRKTVWNDTTKTLWIAPNSNSQIYAISVSGTTATQTALFTPTNGSTNTSRFLHAFADGTTIVDYRDAGTTPIYYIGLVTVSAGAVSQTETVVNPTGAQIDAFPTSALSSALVKAGGVWGAWALGNIAVGGVMSTNKWLRLSPADNKILQLVGPVT